MTPNAPPLTTTEIEQRFTIAGTLASEVMLETDRVLALLDDRARLARENAELREALVKAKRECHDMAIKLGDDVARYMESAAVQSAKNEVERLRAQVAAERLDERNHVLGGAIEHLRGSSELMFDDWREALAEHDAKVRAESAARIATLEAELRALLAVADCWVDDRAAPNGDCDCATCICARDARAALAGGET